MTKSVDEFLRKKRLKKKKFNPKLDHIRWNFEPAKKGEADFDTPKMIYAFFIKYRNPEIIHNKILESFCQGDFHPTIEEIFKYSGKVKGTVNEYLLVGYLSK